MTGQLAARKTTSLVLDSIEVAESQDDYCAFGRRTTTAEVAPSVATIDPFAGLSTLFHHLGQVSEGSTKSYGTSLISLPQGAGGATWPKTWTVTVHAVERDGGGWNLALEKAAECAKENLTDEPIVGALINAGEGTTGTPLPGVVAPLAASYPKGILDDFID